ncbi:MAG: hypothetical protein P1U58_14560 [Verrucomicrobiales bacterium]|nr:hypothetical protein [Verrucomicrobiales bacterium]
MKFLSALLALVFVLPSFAHAEQYGNIAPTLKCHYARKDRSFCKIFPQFSLKHNICRPTPEVVGNIEWCREDITITERMECGTFETYEAVTITYRPVYDNGAWGKKFSKTYRKEPTLIVPRLAKNSIK